MLGERNMQGSRKCVALKRTIAELRTLYYTDMNRIDHRNDLVFTTFELRIGLVGRYVMLDETDMKGVFKALDPAQTGQIEKQQVRPD